ERTESDLETARHNIEQVNEQLEQRRAQLEELPANATAQRRKLEQGIRVIEQSAQTWQREAERLEGELADARPADAADEPPPETPPDEPPEETPDDDTPVEALDDDTPEGTPPEEVVEETEVEPDVPTVSLEEARRLQQMISDYVATQRRSRTENPLLSQFERALEHLTTDIGNSVVEVAPEWANVLRLYDDAPNIAAATMQANFINFVRRELDNAINEPERFGSIIDQIYEGAGTADDIAEMVDGLSDNAQVRAQSAFLDRVIEDWVSGDSRALARLSEMRGDGRLEALLGSETVEAFETLDTIVDNYLNRRPAMSQAEEARHFEAHLQGVIERVRHWQAELQRLRDNRNFMDRESRRIRQEVIESDQQLQLLSEERNRIGQELLEDEAELNRLQAQSRSRRQSDNDILQQNLAEIEERSRDLRRRESQIEAEINRLKQEIERKNAERKQKAEEKAKAEEARVRAEARLKQAKAEYQRYLDLDVADEIADLRHEHRQAQERRNGDTQDPRQRKLDVRIRERLIEEGFDLDNNILARNAIRDFASQDPQNYKIVRDTIREVLGDKKGQVKQMLLYLSGYAFRRAFWTTVAPAAGTGFALGGPMGAALAGGLILGL
ncbi:MAG: hypothetical protein OXG15_02495, partial [Gammaproteobacteria bacterium]|nr:hypothetical protein [Gammaproteobacteria bacterium]